MTPPQAPLLRGAGRYDKAAKFLRGEEFRRFLLRFRELVVSLQTEN